MYPVINGHEKHFVPTDHAVLPFPDWRQQICFFGVRSELISLCKSPAPRKQMAALAPCGH